MQPTGCTRRSQGIKMGVYFFWAELIETTTQVFQVILIVYVYIDDEIHSLPDG